MPTALSTITLTTKNLMVFMILLDSPVKTCLVSHSLDIYQSSVIQTLGCSVQGDSASSEIINSGCYLHFSILNGIADDR